MSRTGRGSTSTGRPAVLPAGSYNPAPPVARDAEGLSVDFHGEDGRYKRFRVDLLPLPGWHESLAAALAVRTGPGGGLRTLASTRTVWDPLGRLLRFLGRLPDPPADPTRLTAEHLRSFLRHRAASNSDASAWKDVRNVGMLIELVPLRDLVSVEVLDYVGRRFQDETRRPAAKPGYSDGELARLVAAARTQVARTRDRIGAGEELLARYLCVPDALTGAELARAEVLATMAATGDVPFAPAPNRRLAKRIEAAGQLFLTQPDVVALLVLLVAVTGRNVETIKELPAEHRVLEERAVELRVTKRRRGPQRWFDTATWEIGPSNRDLHTAGGLYLLVHRLTSRGRGFGCSASLWSVWRNGNRARVSGPDELHDPFARSLFGSFPLRLTDWADRHGVVRDLDDDDTAASRPLALDFNRLKTSIDVRRTKQVGGHLPSAARTNTVPVLFHNYLRGDPTTIAWAHEVIGDAVVDAEQAALDAHQRALQAAGGAIRVVPGPSHTERLRTAGLDADTARSAATGRLDTAWSACTEPEKHPATGKPCEASFLDCFHCGNCLITGDHLPRLLGLLDALAARRRQMGEQAWWARYGPTWAAIRHDVLGRFSPTEIDEAGRVKPADVLLDLVENPWEHP